MTEIKKGMGWKDVPRAGIIPAGGTAIEYETGDWRTFRPVYNADNCIHCLFCWIYCPDNSVTVKDGKMTGFDYDHCKGCGICAEVCPGKKGQKAITMILETEAEAAEESAAASSCCSDCGCGKK